MFIVVKRSYIYSGILALILVLGVSAVLPDRDVAEPVSGSSGVISEELIYLIDPGHGGEDGGAVAADGTTESTLNLEIALRLRDILQFCGKSAAMTREEDAAIYSPGMETLRQKKASDLKNRVAMANQLEKGVLISIHQNALPQSPAVHGAQAFYNTVSGAEEIALRIQQRLNEVINLHKAKECKPIPDSIYLMKHAEIPAVLVECGFLSNGEETVLLRQAAYQKKLSLAIVAGIWKEEESA